MSIFVTVGRCLKKAELFWLWHYILGQVRNILMYEARKFFSYYFVFLLLGCPTRVYATTWRISMESFFSRTLEG